MTKTILMAGVFASIAFAASADEEYNFAKACEVPPSPSAIDGAFATQAQIEAGRDAVTGFIAASDSYQRCLGRALGKQQETAFYMHSNVPVHIVKQIEGKAAANQKEKQRVADEYNAAVAAFHAKKP